VAALRLMDVAATVDATPDAAGLLDELGTGIVLGGGLPVGTVEMAPGVFPTIG
jgi:hypothetical protein